MACVGEKKEESWLAIGPVAREQTGEEEWPASLGLALRLGCWTLLWALSWAKIRALSLIKNKRKR